MRRGRRRRAGLVITTALLTWAAVVGTQPVLSGAAAPAPGVYRIDGEPSQLTFRATSRLQTADGLFHRFEGEVAVDPRDLATARLTLTVDAASIDTKNRKRDDHLRSADFFDVARHPTVTFQSDRVTVAGSLVTVHGRLTMRGVTRAIDVPARVELVGDNTLVAQGEFALNRQDYGISYSSILNPIHDVIRVSFVFHARRKA